MTRPDTLWQRYRNTWQQAWRQRKALDAPARSADESEFLPAALALQETPPHPAPRVFLWSIMVFAAIALLWACVGRVDVVAVASGKVVPSGRTKLIQPSEAAVVKAIHVSDGQPVRAGELLLELDPTTAGADVRRGESELLAARIDVARSSAMLQAIASGQAPLGLHGGLEDADASQVQDAERWLHGQYQEFRNNLDQADAEIQRRAAEIEAAQAQVASLRKSLPIVTQLAEDYQNMLGEQYVARHEYLDKHQARLDMERQLKVQQASVRQASAAQAEARRRREGVVAQARRSLLDLQQTAGQKVASLQQALAKARYQQARTRLLAPVDGTVQQLAVHTVGGVVTPAQALMVIVPAGQPVEVEALLQNKDVGFVHPGQRVTVKVETFTYTRYGTVQGEVMSVSRDAIEDPRRGLVYSSRIRLASDHLQVNGQPVPLMPGMAVSAEIRTSQRTVIGYFLSPLQQHVQESLRER